MTQPNLLALDRHFDATVSPTLPPARISGVAKTWPRPAATP